MLGRMLNERVETIISLGVAPTMQYRGKAGNTNSSLIFTYYGNGTPFLPKTSVRQSTCFGIV